MESDADYFRRRASEEYLAARDAGHSGARQAHQEMGERFEDLAEAIEARERVCHDNPFIHSESASQRAERGTMWL